MNHILLDEFLIYGYIYCVTNVINKKRYVGQTTKKVEQRFKEHKISSKKNPKTYFHRAIAKYGIENFQLEILDYAHSYEELNQKEEDWVYILNTFVPAGYNMTTGGHQCVALRGRLKHFTNKITKEHVFCEEKDKPENFERGRIMDDDFGLKQAQKNKGRHWYYNQQKQKETFCYEDECPDDYIMGRLPFKKETINNISQRCQKSRWFYDPISGKETFCYEEKKPDGYSYGRNPHKMREIGDKQKGKKWFINIETNEKIYCYPNNVPEGFIQQNQRK